MRRWQWRAVYMRARVRFVMVDATVQYTVCYIALRRKQWCRWRLKVAGGWAGGVSGGAAAGGRQSGKGVRRKRCTVCSTTHCRRFSVCLVARRLCTHRHRTYTIIIWRCTARRLTAGYEGTPPVLLRCVRPDRHRWIITSTAVTAVSPVPVAPHNHPEAPFCFPMYYTRNYNTCTIIIHQCISDGYTVSFWFQMSLLHHRLKCPRVLGINIQNVKCIRQRPKCIPGSNFSFIPHQSTYVRSIVHG